MKIGNFVKGKPESDNEYSITTSAMTRGVIVGFKGDYIRVKILEHTNGEKGLYDVNPEFFEAIGNVKPFSKNEVLELLQNGCKKAILDYDLSGADLSEANLRGAYLSEANLSGANLSEANLSEANLSGANLSEANLRGADLRGADLRGADLSEANLRGAYLSGAYFSGVDLSGADLRGADLSEANLDFSCLPLRCGGLKWLIDKRLACQLTYHLCSMQCDDEEFIKLRNLLLPFANQFHRVKECGALEPVEKGKK